MMTYCLLVAVSVDSRKPVAAVWPDTVYLCCHSSIQRGAVFRHHSTLGRYWLATHNLHGMSVTRMNLVQFLSWSLRLMHISFVCFWVSFLLH